MKQSTLFTIVLFQTLMLVDVKAQTGWSSTEVHRFAAEEAGQGVAVDANHFYAISNRRIGKYRKNDGRKVASWADRTGEFIHLNAGVVINGKLYAAHSNFPSIPMVSSVEVWDTSNLTHVESHSLGIEGGSLTWLDRKGGFWYACFVNYTKEGGDPGHGVEWSQVVKFDDQWRRLNAWVFPPALVEKFDGFSCSCGGFGPGGKLFVTGHNAKELYVVEFPQAGSVLKWVDTVPVSNEGQAFAWDPATPDVEYGIVRSAKKVVACKVSGPTPAPVEVPTSNAK